MQVKEYMTKKVECVPPDMPLREAARRMRSLNVGVLPVCDRDELVGILSLGDFTRAPEGLGVVSEVFEAVAVRR